MKVLWDGKISWDELSAFARWSWDSIKGRFKFAGPGKKINYITTSDFDGAGKLKDSAKRRIEEIAKAAKR
jgi:hypothetical protein